MSRPEEFRIHIEPDGRIVLENGTMTEDSYRRILEFLQETMGPVQAKEQSDPLSGRLMTRTRSQNDQQLKIGPK